MIAVSPLLGIKLFNYLNRIVHTSLNNGAYMTFFIFFLSPLFIREIFLVENLIEVSYVMDGISVAYSLFLLLFWANKDDILFVIRQARSILGSKKGRLKIFERLKIAKFDYENIVQNFLYFHTIYLSVSYYYIKSLSELLMVTYYIIYFSPIMFYFSTLRNC